MEGRKSSATFTVEEKPGLLGRAALDRPRNANRGSAAVYEVFEVTQGAAG